jgi:uncharacterized protein YjbJ (UPF0337 family)
MECEFSHFFPARTIVLKSFSLPASSLEAVAQLDLPPGKAWNLNDAGSLASADEFPRIQNSQEMRTMVNKDQVAGMAKQVKGSVKEAAGKATGNRQTQAEGTADKIAGKVQKAYGDVKDKVSKAL